jgi:hypothetical protein
MYDFIKACHITKAQKHTPLPWEAKSLKTEPKVVRKTFMKQERTTVKPNHRGDLMLSTYIYMQYRRHLGDRRTKEYIFSARYQLQVWP